MFIWFVYKYALFLVITTYVLWHFLAYLHCFFQGETAASGGKPSVVLEGQYSVKEAPVPTDPKRSPKMRFSGWPSKNRGFLPPKWMVENFMENPIFWKWMIWGVFPLFLETPICPMNKNLPMPMADRRLNFFGITNI